jgi:hypothetical protein
MENGTKLQSSKQETSHERLRITTWEKSETNKLTAEDMLDFCNSMNEYLLNHKNISVIIEKVRIEPDEENKLMTRVIVEYAVFGTSRVKKEYDLCNENCEHTWTSYRSIDFSCKNISSEARDKDTKRACKVCGQTHTGCPFTDCYSGSEESLPDSLQDSYKSQYGDEEDDA